MSDDEKKRVFISYSWSKTGDDQFVINLAKAIKDNGVEVILDKWHLKPGQDTNAFMEKMVVDPSVSHVLMLCDREYQRKANARVGGVGTEAQIISPALYKKVDQTKFIPVVRERGTDGEVFLPAFMTGRKYVDLSSDEQYDKGLDELVRLFYEVPLYPEPKLGKEPVFKPEPQPPSPLVRRRAKKFFLVLMVLALLGIGASYWLFTHSGTGSVSDGELPTIAPAAGELKNEASAAQPAAKRPVARVSQAQDFEAIKRAAEQGDADAQNSLGVMYAKGQGVAQNDAEAVKWLREAAEQGEAKAQSNLGAMYTEGRGVAQNDVEALKWFRKAAEQGFVDAQFNLGLMYVTGKGVAQNDAEAMKWYRKAAEQGDESAQNSLGVMYAKAQGIAQNDAEAVKWYRKAAEQGFVDAQYNLGVMYGTGKGVAQNDAEAVRWFRKAAERGHETALRALEKL